ncbi:uncharacterized protein Bfra_001188 [Botrytis fragariae]|uniref:Uncharacterized protein n=1 Tax=Botrytis fragariae TaxID=1964551 RepID=A0A8H6AZZ7_9HELO|nr:uncharacterized protein Bfra_001188 [Botrytis fragariae]KAF5876834.1 hypothetical protein Bfra_001188 [Botrytis fragariae]
MQKYHVQNAVNAVSHGPFTVLEIVAPIYQLKNWGYEKNKNNNWFAGLVNTHVVCKRSLRCT